MFVIKLIGCIFQAIREVVAGSANGGFLLKQMFHAPRSQGRCAGGEIDAFARFDGHFEITGHVLVFVVGIASFLFLWVFYILIPIGCLYEFILMGELHVKFRITVIQAHFHTIVHFFDGFIQNGIFQAKLVCPAECQKGFEPKSGGGMSLQQGEFDQNPVFVGNKNKLLGKDYAPDAVNGGRVCVAFILSDVFVTFGAVVFSGKLVNAQVEFRSVLDDSSVKGGNQNMILSIQFGQGDNQQAVVFTGVAIHDGRVAVSARFIRPEHFLGQGLLEIDHEGLVEFQITHGIDF